MNIDERMRVDEMSGSVSPSYFLKSEKDNRSPQGLEAELMQMM